MSVIDKLILILCINGSFNLIIQIFKKCLILINFSLYISLFVSDSPITICGKIFVFSLFPSQFERLNGLKYKPSLVIRKLSILTHRIETYNKFLFESKERSSFNFWPFFDLLLKWFIVGLSSLSFVVLLFFKLVNFLLEFCSLLAG